MNHENRLFVLPPSIRELKRRLDKRGTETGEAISLRINETLEEASKIDLYDYCVVNGELNEAVARVKAIMLAEHLKISDGIHDFIKKLGEES